MRCTRGRVGMLKGMRKGVVLEETKERQDRGPVRCRFDECHISSASLAYFCLKELFTSHKKSPDHVANMAKRRVRIRARGGVRVRVRDGRTFSALSATKPKIEREPNPTLKKQMCRELSKDEHGVKRDRMKDLFEAKENGLGCKTCNQADLNHRSSEPLSVLGKITKDRREECKPNGNNISRKRSLTNPTGSCNPEYFRPTDFFSTDQKLPPYAGR